MAEVLVTIKIMPESAETDINKIKEEIKQVKKGRLDKIEEEPIAFGLVALRSSFVVQETEGATDDLEETLKKIPGVGDVSVVRATRLF